MGGDFFSYEVQTDANGGSARKSTDPLLEQVTNVHQEGASHATFYLRIALLLIAALFAAVFLFRKPPMPQ